MSPSPARGISRRGEMRRELILTAAADLVAVRGFHAVGVSDIGAAAGVTGAALYRHFGNKSEVLVALFERVIDELLDNARMIQQRETTAGILMTALVRAHVAFALRAQSILTVYSQQAHNLPLSDQRRLRRKQRHYVEIWKDALQGLEPAMSDNSALARVEAVFGLLNSAPNLSAALPETELAHELFEMACAALHAPGRADEPGGRVGVPAPARLPSRSPV